MKFLVNQLTFGKAFNGNESIVVMGLSYPVQPVDDSSVKSFMIVKCRGTRCYVIMIRFQVVSDRPNDDVFHFDLLVKHSRFNGEKTSSRSCH